MVIEYDIQQLTRVNLKEYLDERGKEGWEIDQIQAGTWNSDHTGVMSWMVIMKRQAQGSK